MSMTRTELLLAQLDHTYSKEAWFAPLTHALEGITAAQAAWQPTPESNSIWQTLNHLTFWNQFMLNRFRGVPRIEGPITNGDTFGEPGDPADEPGWLAAVERTKTLHADMRGFCTEGGDGALDQILRDSTVGTTLADLVIHDAYHLGQIILLRKLQGSWPAQRNE